MTGVSSRRLKLAVALSTVVAAGMIALGCGGGEEQADPASESGPAQSARQSRDEGTSASSEDSAGEGGSVSIQSGSGSSVVQSDGSSSVSSGGGSVSASGGSTSQSSTSAAGVSNFSGRGASKLSFNVERPSRLAWTNSEGKTFSAEGGGISIRSRTGRGEMELKPGDYDNVRVEGTTWTIVIRPR